MAAGLGFKDFTTGEVLTAADVDGYLMQGIWVFASAAARDAAVTSPQEGNFAFLKDTNTTTYYTGSAWTNLDTTGMVNPMTTTGDTIYSSSGSTPARLGIGSTGDVLTVAGGVPSWAAPAGGGANWSLLNAGGTALTGAGTVTVSGISGKDKVAVLIENASSSSAGVLMGLRINGDSGTNYIFMGPRIEVASSYSPSNLLDGWAYTGDDRFRLGYLSGNAGSLLSGSAFLTGCNSSGLKSITFCAGVNQSGGSNNVSTIMQGFYNSSSTISSISIVAGSGNLDSGTVYVYTSA